MLEDVERENLIGKWKKNITAQSEAKRSDSIYLPTAMGISFINAKRRNLVIQYVCVMVMQIGAL